MTDFDLTAPGPRLVGRDDPRASGRGRLQRELRSRRHVLIGAALAAASIGLEACARALGTTHPIAPRVGEPIRRASPPGPAVTAATPTQRPVRVENVVPQPVPPRAPQPVLTATARPDLRTKIAQMLLVGFHGTVVDDRSPVIRDIVEQGLGGVILFDRRNGAVRNIASPAQLRALTARLHAAASRTRLPLIVAVDQEGGNVARLNPKAGFPGTYTAADLGARNDPAFTRARATDMARTLAAMGINLNLAPVVDLNLNPRNPIIGAKRRSFSADPAVVTSQAAAFIAGHDAVGVRTALKHFPGHGSATGDTHRGVVDVTGHWREVELEPFANLIAAGHAEAIMTAHIYNAGLDARRPATLSAAVVGKLLRERLGYGGVVISDDLQMGAIKALYRYEEAVALAIEAGVDLLTIGDPSAGIVKRTVDAVVGFIKAGRLSEARIDASYERLRALRETLLSRPA